MTKEEFDKECFIALEIDPVKWRLLQEKLAEHRDRLYILALSKLSKRKKHKILKWVDREVNKYVESRRL